MNFDKIDKDLIKEAYKVGRSRGTSLSLGYYLSLDGKSIFCQNPNSSEGVIVGEDSGYSENPNFEQFDMSDALAFAENREKL